MVRCLSAVLCYILCLMTRGKLHQQCNWVVVTMGLLPVSYTHLDVYKRQVRTLIGHTDRVNSAAYSPDGTHLVTASDDQTARIWDAATGQEVRTLSGHTDSVWSVAYSPDGAHLVTASLDQTARIWDAATGQEVRTFSGHTAPVLSAAYGLSLIHI